MYVNSVFNVNILHTNIRVLLSFLAPIDFMVLRCVSKQTCTSVQSYAYLLTTRTIQLLNPYNIFARSVMYNSFKTITPSYKSDKVCDSTFFCFISIVIIVCNLLFHLFSLNSALGAVLVKTIFCFLKETERLHPVETILMDNSVQQQGLLRRLSFNT